MNRRNLLRTASVFVLGGFVAACSAPAPTPPPGPTPVPDPNLSRAQQIVAAIAASIPVLVQLATSVAGVPAATVAKWQLYANQIATTARNILDATSTVGAGQYVNLFETALTTLLTDLSNSGLLPADARTAIQTINLVLPTLLGIFNMFVPNARRTAVAAPVDVDRAIADLNGFARRHGR